MKRLVLLAVGWLVITGAAPLPLEPPLPDLAALVPWASAPFDKPALTIPPVPMPPPPNDVLLPPVAPIVVPEEPKPAAPVPSPRVLPCAGAWLGIASESLECGRSRFAKGEFEEAARALENAVRRANERDLQAEARYWQAEALYRLGQFERADWLFTQVAQEQGRREFGPWALHGSGWTALRLGDWGRARETFSQVLAAAHPAAVDAWSRHGLGLALYALGRFKEAERAWTELASRPLPAQLARDVQFWRGDVAGRLDDPRRAADELARFVAGGPHPLLPAALVRLGWWRLRTDQAAEAADAFRAFRASPAARQSGGDRDWADAGLALASIANGDAAGAGTLLRELDARRSPLGASVRLRLVAAALQRNQVADAQAMIQELLAANLGPGVRPWVLVAKGEASRADGNRDEARTQFELARTADPNGDTGRYAAFRLAQTNLEMREFAQAVNDVSPILGAPVSPALLTASLILLGEAAYQAGQYPQAAAAYQRVLVEAPDLPEAPSVRLALAWTALRQAKLDDARRQFVEFADALPSDPHTPDALQLASEIALNTGAFDAGRALIERIVTTFPGNPRADLAVFNRALLLLRTGQSGAAESILRDWIKRARSSPLLGRAWFAYGAAALAAGRPPEAAKAFASARQEGAADLGALGAGMAALAENRLDDATRELESARDTGAAAVSSVAEYGLATIALRKGNADEFRKIAARLLAAAPRGPLAPPLLYAMAGLDADAKNWSAALAEAKRLATDFPAHTAADDGLARVGMAAAASGAWPVAYEALGLLRQKFPQSPLVESSRLQWSEALLETGRAGEARQALEQTMAAAGDQADAAALVALGRAREATGDQAGALDAFSRAAKAGGAGWTPGAMLAYARVLAAGQRWDDARKTVDPVVHGADPALASEAALVMGDAYRGEGQLLAAAEYYMTAAYLTPQSPVGQRALLAAGKAFAALKQPDAAATVYRKLLAQADVPGDVAAAARQALAELKR